MTTLREIHDDNLIITLDQLKNDSQLIRNIEIRLKDLGLISSDDVNGAWDNITETALKTFCQVVFLNSMTTGLFGRTFAKKIIEMPGPITTAKPNQAVTLDLKGSVGQNGNNNPGDVLAVKNRLVDLGFSWVGRNSNINSETIRTIRLFQSIINGRTVVSGDGRIDVKGFTHKFLQAANAPRWQEMPNGSSSEGFINFDNIQRDTHDFGTDWMIEMIKAAGKLYLTNHRNTNTNAALIATNNLSVERGGDSPFHATHESGISCDIVLPRKNGTSGGITHADSRYDQNAMRAMLQAIRGQNEFKIKQIFFNDISLITEGLCQSLINHDNHAHIDIVPPQPK